MKVHYDKGTNYRSFAPGDEVLVLLPLQGQLLGVRYSGSYVTESRVGDLNFMVATPDRRRRAQLSLMFVHLTEMALFVWPKKKLF